MNDRLSANLAEAWQSRAKECHAAAKRLRSADARRRMMAAAEDFERMAFDARGGPPDPWAGMTL